MTEIDGQPDIFGSFTRMALCDIEGCFAILPMDDVAIDCVVQAMITDAVLRIGIVGAKQGENIVNFLDISESLESGLVTRQ